MNPKKSFLLRSYILVLLGISVYYSFYFFLIMLTRTKINFILGPFEDYFLQAFYQYKNGKPIYAFPTIDYVAQIYGPFYLYLSKLLISFSQINLPNIRLVSVISNISLPVVFFFILRSISRVEMAKFKTVLATLLFSGLYFVSYDFTGYWLDLAKVDSLLNFWILLSILIYIWILKSEVNFRLLLLLFAFAWVCSEFIFIKQSLLVLPFLYFVLIFFFKNRKVAFVYLFFYLFLQSFLLWNEIRELDNYYLFFNFILPSLHPLSERYFLKEVLILIIPQFILICAFEIITFNKIKFQFDKYWRHILNERVYYSLILIFLSLISIGILGRMKHGGFVNSFLYAYCVLTAISVFLLYFHWETISNFLMLSQFALFALLLLQFKLLQYSPHRVYKSYLKLTSIETEYQQKFCDIPGVILYEKLSFMGKVYCNKRPFFTLYSATDLLPSDPFVVPLIEEYKNSFKNRIYDRLILEEAESELASANFYQEAVKDYELNPTIRNKNKVLLHKAKWERFDSYERILTDELTESERKFLEVHKILFPPIVLFRKKIK